MLSLGELYPRLAQQKLAVSDANVCELAGLFMALQPRIIACGNTAAAFAMAVRFLTGPAVMAAASIAVGLRGTLLHVAIVQVTAPLSCSLPSSALPLAVRPSDLTGWEWNEQGSVSVMSPLPSDLF